MILHVLLNFTIKNSQSFIIVDKCVLKTPRNIFYFLKIKIMIQDIGFEIQTPSFNFVDYDPIDNSFMAYRVRFDKQLYTEPYIQVTLDNCTGIPKKDCTIPKK